MCVTKKPSPTNHHLHRRALSPPPWHIQLCHNSLSMMLTRIRYSVTLWPYIMTTAPPHTWCHQGCQHSWQWQPLPTSRTRWLNSTCHIMSISTLVAQFPLSFPSLHHSTKPNHVPSPMAWLHGDQVSSVMLPLASKSFLGCASQLGVRKHVLKWALLSTMGQKNTSEL